MYCRQCHYNLHGLTEYRCPECGKPYQPSNPSSFYTKIPTAGDRILGSLQMNIHWREWIAVSVCLFWLYVLFIAATGNVRGGLPRYPRQPAASANNLKFIMAAWLAQQDESKAPQSAFDKEAAQSLLQPGLSLWTEYDAFERRRDIQHSLEDLGFLAFPLATILGTIALLWRGWVRRIAGVVAALLVLITASSGASRFLVTLIVPGTHAYLDDYVFLDQVDLRQPKGRMAAYDRNVLVEGGPRVIAFDDGRGEVIDVHNAQSLFERQGLGSHSAGE